MKLDDRCGVMTELGPCTMKKGHELNGGATYHRHKIYNALQWEMFEQRGEKKIRLDSGEGVNQLTTAISRNRVNGAKLFIEVNC